MAREVFCSSHDPCVLHAFDIGHSKPGHFKFILTKRTVTNNRVIRIVINIHYRGIVYMHTNAFHLLPYSHTHVIHNLIIG